MFADPSFQAKNIVDVKSISVIPKSYEHFMSQSFNFYCEMCIELRKKQSIDPKVTLKFCTHQFVIQMLDSYNHLGASLRKMVEELNKSCTTWEQEITEFKPLHNWIEKKYHDRDENLRKTFFQTLKSSKQFFPYGILSQVHRLSETKLPEKKDWYDTLNKEFPPDENITYANYAFELFQCSDIMAYLRIYLEADIGLLCCVFESWRNLLRNHYTLDLANFISLRK